MSKMRYHEWELYNSLSDFEKEFMEYHIIRLEGLLHEVEQLAESCKRILNIGLSVFDLMVIEKLKNKNIEYKSAVPNPSFGKASIYKEVPQIQIDLCNPKDPNSAYEGYFDLVIFSGVMEHLFCNDESTFKALNKFLRKDGLLLVFVPNAASFINRIKICLGKNIHWSKSEIVSGTKFGGYGHIREYTKAELQDLGKDYFDVLRFYSVNDYVVRGVDFSRFNRVIPVTYSIDIGALYRKK